MVVVAEVVDGSAKAGIDYTPIGPVTLTFPPGTTSQPLTVPVSGDLLDEADETFTVSLTDLSVLRGGRHARFFKAQGVGTIRNDDGVTPPQPPGPAPAPPVVSPPDPNNADEKPKETEDERRQRARTNQAGKDDEHIEGNVVEVYPGDRPPYVVIANRDGLVTVVLFKDAAKAADEIRVGDYLEAAGEKQHVQLFHATEVEIGRGGRSAATLV